MLKIYYYSNENTEYDEVEEVTVVASTQEIADSTVVKLNWFDVRIESPEKLEADIRKALTDGRITCKVITLDDMKDGEIMQVSCMRG